MLRFALLGFLHYRPMTGYELNRALENSTANFWHARLSQIYVTLKQLEQDGLVTSTVQPQEDRPDRRLYNLTPGGLAAFEQWVRQPITEVESHKMPLLLKLFFSGGVDKDALLTQLRLQRELHLGLLQQLRTESAAMIQQAAREAPGFERDAFLWDATRRFGEMYEEALVRWLDETIAMVKAQF